MDFDRRPPEGLIQVMQGDAIVFGPITVWQPRVDESAPRIPVNLSGATVRSQMRRGDRVIDSTVTMGSLVDGVITRIKFAGADTRNAQPGPWDWDIEITDSLGDPLTVARAVIEITRDASRA